MSRIPWLCSTVVAAWLSAGLAGETQAQERSIPNFTSANFGWLVNTGFDYRPVEGTVAHGFELAWRHRAPDQRFQLSASRRRGRSAPAGAEQVYGIPSLSLTSKIPIRRP